MTVLCSSFTRRLHSTKLQLQPRLDSTLETCRHHYSHLRLQRLFPSGVSTAKELVQWRYWKKGSKGWNCCSVGDVPTCAFIARHAWTAGVVFLVLSCCSADMPAAVVACHVLCARCCHQELPASSIQHPASSIQHPASSIKLNLVPTLQSHP